MQVASEISSPAQYFNINGSDLKFQVVHTLEELKQYRQCWFKLATQALEPNVFYEPEPLLASIASLSSQANLSVLLVFKNRSDKPDNSDYLIGLFPFLREQRGPRNVLSNYKLYTNNLQCGLTTPLVDAQYAELAIHALLKWMDSLPNGTRYFGLNGLSGDGEFGRVLRKLLKQQNQPHMLESSFTRALFRPLATNTDFLNAALSTKRKKEYRRLRNRLEDLGKLEVQVCGKNDLIEPWIEDFLNLEAKGWKNSVGNAILTDTADSNFFRTMITAAHARQQVMMIALVLDNNVIASKCNLFSADKKGAFAYKISFDEEYARYSPGVLLELENIKLLHEMTPRVMWMDSCAFPNHPMINRLWPGRREIIDLFCGSREPISKLAIKALNIKNHYRNKATPVYQSPGNWRKKNMQHLELIPKIFLEHFPIKSFPIKHHLADHPLLKLERLVELAKSMPPNLVECAKGDVDYSLGFDTTPDNGLSIEETVRRIKDCGSWMVLKQVQEDPEYAELLHSCVKQIEEFSKVKRPGMQMLEAYIFISSPNSVTPYHFDDEHNFLLQIHGSKTMRIWNGQDPKIVSYIDFERAYSNPENPQRNIPFKEEFGDQNEAYILQPGDGVHIPVHSPHWVQNGPEVSVSFSVTFRSKELMKESTVHWMNAKLRERGFSILPYGKRPLVDSIKYCAVRARAKILRVLKR